MPSSAFRERIDRDAQAKIKKALGCTLEEAQELLKVQRAGGGAAPAPGTPAAPAPGATAAPAAPARPNAELEKLRREKADLERRTEALRAKVKKVKTRARDRLLETELRYSAVAAGIKADDADYAMGLYRAKVRATPQGEDVPDPDSFWPTLKAAKGYLFVDGAPAREVPIRPTTAPPASKKPGEEVPPARGAGAPAAEKGVMEMEPEEFGARTSNRYGFRPPQSA